MPVERLLALVTASYGVVMAVSPLLQIRRMRVSRSSDDVSVGYFMVLNGGFVLWVAYGWTRSDPVLVVPNTVALAVGLTTVAVALRLRKPPGATP